jgi:uncharacterized membrane protein YbhN (UPF0104 family)
VFIRGSDIHLMVKKYLPLLLTLGAVVCLGAYIGLHREELAAVSLQSPGFLGLCALGVLASFLASGLLGYATVHKLGKQVGLLESLNLSVVTTAANLLLPMQGGLAVRAVYLKRLHRFEYSNFVAALFGTQVLMTLVCSLAAAAAVLWMALVQRRPGLGPVLAGAALCLAGSALAACLPRLRVRPNWFLARLAAVSDGWHRLRAEPRFLANLTAITALQLGSQLLSYWAACAVIGIHLGVAEATAVGTFGALATLLSVTPGNLGIYEAVVAFVGATLAVEPVHSVMAALLGRAVLLATLLVLTPPAVYWLGKQAGRDGGTGDLS